MDRRDFITAIIAVSLVPASVVASNSRLTELEKKLRARFGEDTDEILSVANRCCRKVVEENRDLNQSDEDDLELLTEVALQSAVKELRAKGLWS